MRNVSPLALDLAAQGWLVLAPVLVDRRDDWSGSEAMQRFTNQPHREWIYRQAFEMGRTLIGYEVDKVLAAIDAMDDPGFPGHPADGKVAVHGYGEGGELALICAALDERIGSTVVSGYFGPREQLFCRTPLSEPV